MKHAYLVKMPQDLISKGGKQTAKHTGNVKEQADVAILAPDKVSFKLN